VALADDAARVVTRYGYDAWGQFRPEAPDTTRPAVARITATVDGLQLEFSETVLPPVVAPEFPGLQSGVRAFGAVADVSLDGVPVGGSWRYAESVAGRPFGSVLQFASARPLAGNVEVRLNAGVAMDDWNNRNIAAAVSFPVLAGTAAGTGLSTPAIDSPVAATAQLSPFLFQGQLFDPEAGLYYLRARFYDPASGSFLQRDPEAYGDSPNSYAGLAHNPASMRDPSGRGITPPSGPRSPAASPAAVRGRVITSQMPVSQPRTPIASRTPDTVAPTTLRTSKGRGKDGRFEVDDLDAQVSQKTVLEMEGIKARTEMRQSIDRPEKTAGIKRPHNEFEARLFRMSEAQNRELAGVHYREPGSDKITSFVVAGRKASVSTQDILDALKSRGINVKDVVGLDHTHPHGGEAIFSAKAGLETGRISGDIVANFKWSVRAESYDVNFRVIGRTETREATGYNFRDIPSHEKNPIFSKGKGDLDETLD
jgi:RHS repeat-associated protein